MPEPTQTPTETGNANEHPDAGHEIVSSDQLDEAARQAATAERNWYTLSHIVGAIEDDPAEDVFELARNVVAAADRAASWWEAAKTLNRAWKGANAMRASDAWLNREKARQCDEVVLALGPLYNDDHHSWSVEKLAQKAAADIASGTKRDTSIDAATVGAMARIIALAGDEKRRADAAEAKLAEVRAIAAESAELGDHDADEHMPRIRTIVDPEATREELEHADDCHGCDGPDVVPCAADRVIGDVAYRDGVPIKNLRTEARRG